MTVQVTPIVRVIAAMQNLTLTEFEINVIMHVNHINYAKNITTYDKL